MSIQNLTARPANEAGALALIHTGKRLPLQVLRSAAGYYLGTFDNGTEDGPVSRESVEYFPTHEAARHALHTGAWTQRPQP
jgi:hypothetical protein